MSWTSEFEPPPPRPNIENDDDPVDDGAEGAVEAGVKSTVDIWTDVSEPIEIPDEGPLDPSIFDGLFDDLTEDDQPTDTEPEDDQPTDTEPEDDQPTETGLDAPSEPSRPVEPTLEPDEFHAQPADEPLPLPLSDDEDVGSPDDDDFDQDDDFGSNGVAADGATAGSLLDSFDPEVSLFGDHDDSGSQADGEPSTDTGGLESDHVDNAFEIADKPPAQATEAPPHGETHASEAQIHSEAPIHIEHDDGAAAEVWFEPIGRTAEPVEPLESQEPVERGPIVSTGEASEQASGHQPAVARRRAAGARRWPAFAMAILIGAVLGIGGAVILARIVDQPEGTESAAGAQTGSPEDQPDAGAVAAGGATGNEATGNGATEGESGDDDVAGDGSVGAATEPVAIGDLVAGGDLELNTIRFIPGTLNLTEASLAALGELAEAAADQPAAPTSVAVRTYSEPTALENQVLSQSQAQTIGEYLTGLGLASDSVQVSGLGAPPLTETQPVRNFVAVSAGLRPSALKTAVQGLHPFAIGVDPSTNRLRPESLEPLKILGQAMASYDDGEISLAAYAHSGPDSAANQQLAATAATAVADHLAANYGIDPDRMSVLTPGQAPYIVSADAGNHISLRWGRSGTSAAAVAAIDLGAISFQPGSAVLDGAAETALNELVSVVGSTEETVVIEVHTATEDTDAANAELGRSQATAITDYLVDSGLAPDRVRVHGTGRLRQFQGQDQASLIVITVVG